jgi:hypothetical protein
MRRLSVVWARVAVGVLVVAGCSDALAQGKLDAFAADAGARSYGVGSSAGSSGSCVGAFFGEVFSEIIGATLAEGGAISLARVSGGADDGDVRLREIGEPELPFARMDVVYQSIESDVEAVDARVELGYGPIGVHGNLTRYREREPHDNLSILRVYGAYRMSFGSYAEMDLGIGALTMMGDPAPTKLLLSVPFLFHPSEYVGIEFRPAWADRVSDYDLAALLSVKCVSLKLGYRWVCSPQESLNGPYVGVSIRL